MCDPQLSALVAECLSSAARDICALFERTVAQYEHKVALLQRTIADHERFRGPSIRVQVKVEDLEETQLIKEELPPELPVTELLYIKPLDEDQDQEQDKSTEIPVETLAEEPALQPEQKHICTRCGKHFTRKSVMNLHLRNHNGLRPFSCSVCTKSFMQRSHLKQHLVTHTKDRPFSCSFCGRSFTKNADLKRHMLIHTGQKPHKCFICDSSFNQKSSLMQHQRIHAGGRPFTCSVCDKGFLAKKDHVWHQSFVHHLCPVCSQRFTERTTLGEHLRIHVEEGALDPTSALFKGIATPFCCSHCGKSFTKNFDCKRHMRKHRTGHMTGHMGAMVHSGSTS